MSDIEPKTQLKKKRTRAKAKPKKVYKPGPVSKPKPRPRPRVELKLYSGRNAPEPCYVGKSKDADKLLKEMKAYLKDHGVTCADPKTLCSMKRGKLEVIIIPNRQLWDNLAYTLKLIQPLSEKMKLDIKANPAGLFRLVHIKSDDKSLGIEMAKIYLSDEANKYNIGFGAYGHFIEMDAGLARRHWGPEADRLGKDARRE